MVREILKEIICMMMVTSIFSNQETFTLKIGDFEKAYPIRQPKSGAPVKIAYVNDFADNMALLRATTKGLREKIKAQNLIQQIDIVVIPGDKANALGALLVEKLSIDNPHLKLVIFRTTDKGGTIKSVNYQSLTSSTAKKLYASEYHQHLIQGKNVMIMDDVISTGATVKAAAELVNILGGKVKAYACGATEGEKDLASEISGKETFDGLPFFKVAHFPLIKI
ncbi:phosphoribosyltransferase family protein [Candidatus Odyssella acanthamoebae]|uniref:Phosphoribosyltransferase domain-containing protein n=1 Tax=Candidatus Odyssella acanthamoebae TaxID=91604 RepID=A0A077AWI7_9PROT|nr:phosphoribosyltransferase family protein [Candidatus Paracaedibacter acanthamoebae]AIK96811.1 hypothetical protein ID47_08825 [Candidatus Paracaedibacter acanthamoebae]